ncbi:MAG: hypothetical protein GX557_08700 [Chloroflexi bacterium]|nr:hypothetical protein [Chloroflexota bacterium]
MAARLSRVYFPLRSAVGWFRSRDGVAQVERRLKLAMLLYDELLVEDGTYMCALLENSRFSQYFPPGTWVDRSVDYDKDIRNSEFALWLQPEGPGHEPVVLANGRTIAKYKADYHDLLDRCDPGRFEFVKRLSGSDDLLPEDAQRRVEYFTRQDEKRYARSKTNRFLIHEVLKNLNRDLVVSTLLGSAVVLGPTHGRLLRSKSLEALRAKGFAPQVEPMVAQHLFTIRVPDVSSLSWDEVAALREEGTWPSFRRMVSDIARTVGASPDARVSLDSEVRDAIQAELCAQLERKQMSRLRLAVDLVMGGLSLLPVPAVGVATSGVSAAQSVAQYLNDRRSWLAFLIRAAKVSSEH